jgi:hypothetical protein
MPQTLSVVFLALALLPSGEDSTAPLAAPLAVYGEISMGAEEATLDLEAEVETTWRLVLTALEVDQLALPDEVLADTWLVIDDLWLRLEVLPWKSGDWTRVRLRAGTMERAEDVVRARELLEGVIRGLESLRLEQAREQEAQRAAEREAQRLAAGRYVPSDFRVPAVWVLPTWIPFHTMLWADAWVWSHGVWDASQTVIHHTVGWWGDPWCFDDDDYYDDWDDLASADDDDLPMPGGNGGADDDGTGGGDDDDVIDHVPPLNPRIAHWDGGRLPARTGPTGTDVSVSARGGPGSSGKGGSKGSGGQTFGGGVASGGSTGSTGTSGSGSKGSRSIVLPALPLGALRPSRGTITISGFGRNSDVRVLPRVSGSSGRTSGGSGGSTTVASGGSGSGSTGSTFGSSSGSSSGSNSGSNWGTGSSSGSNSGSSSGSFGSSRTSPSLGRTPSISSRPSSTTTSGRSSFGSVSLPGRGSLSLPKSNTSSRSAPARASAPKSKATPKASSSGKSSGSKSGGSSKSKSSGSKSGGKSKSKSSKGRP